MCNTNLPPAIIFMQGCSWRWPMTRIDPSSCFMDPFLAFLWTAQTRTLSETLSYTCLHQ